MRFFTKKANTLMLVVISILIFIYTSYIILNVVKTNQRRKKLKVGDVCKVYLGESQFNGILNMGVQPTFGENEFRIEVHLLDFEQTLYGQEVEVLFVNKMRDERAFDSPEELADQIKKDEVVARKILNDIRL